MSENRKKISIASNGPLPIYGGIFGPIRSPFYETIQNISSLISSGAEVYEHVGDKKVKLDMVNFDKVQSVEAKVVQSNQNQKAQEQKAAKAEDIIKIPAQNQNYKNDKKNKHNNNNQQQQQQAQVEKVQEQQAAPVVDEVAIEE